MTQQPNSSNEPVKMPDKPAKPERSRLPPGQQWVAGNRWPYVGERAADRANEPWQLNLTGLVQRPKSWSLSELASLPQSSITMDIHCVTRWSKPDVTFSGVALKTLLGECGVNPEAAFVSFVARSTRQHSSSLVLSEALQLETILAIQVDGQPLTPDHGGPLRSIVPDRFFYKSVKWVERIELLQIDKPGYWEAESGYHNHADPWLQERYIAGAISKREAAGLIESRDFSERDLLSINVSGRDLSDLIATNAKLRNANFSNCDLSSANFEDANLSNANFRNSTLRQVSFRNADLEGADFAGADLRDANFEGASLFGTSFCDIVETDSMTRRFENPAHSTMTTNFDDESLQKLTRDQQDFLQQVKDTNDS